MQHMKSRGFEATSAQYKRQFKKWSLSKNLRSEEWIYISRIINRRLRDGKQTNVLFHGRILEEAQVRKEIRRHDLPTLRQGPVISTAPNIRLCTPPNSNAQDISFPVFTTFPSLEFVQLVNLKGMIIRGSEHNTHISKLKDSHTNSNLAAPADMITICILVQAPWKPLNCARTSSQLNALLRNIYNNISQQMAGSLILRHPEETLSHSKIAPSSVLSS